MCLGLIFIRNSQKCWVSWWVSNVFICSTNISLIEQFYFFSSVSWFFFSSVIFNNYCNEMYAPPSFLRPFKSGLMSIKLSIFLLHFDFKNVLKNLVFLSSLSWKINIIYLKTSSLPSILIYCAKSILISLRHAWDFYQRSFFIRNLFYFSFFFDKWRLRFPTQLGPELH